MYAGLFLFSQNFVIFIKCDVQVVINKCKMSIDVEKCTQQAKMFVKLSIAHYLLKLLQHFKGAEGSTNEILSNHQN